MFTAAVVGPSPGFKRGKIKGAAKVRNKYEPLEELSVTGQGVGAGRVCLWLEMFSLPPSPLFL